MEKLISINNLSKENILHNISFNVFKNEKVAIVGPNGAGKSTLLKLLVGLSVPSNGKIIGNCKKAMVFQNNLLDKRLSVKQNLYIRLEKKNLIQAESLLNQFGITNLNTKYGNLSGGQKRIVNLVRSLATCPELLILDELSAGMDPKIRSSVWNFLYKLHHHSEMSIIYTTHILNELSYADTILFINKGKIRYYGNANKFTKKLPSYKLTVDNKHYYFESSETALNYINSNSLKRTPLEIRKVSYDDLFKYMEDQYDD